MQTSSLLRNLLFVLVLLFSSIGYSQLSKKHYIPPLTESGDGSSAPQDQYIYISTPSNLPVNITIKPVGLGTNGHINGSVSKNNPFIYSIGTGRDTQLFVNHNETSSIKSNKGYIIEAQDLIYVSVRINAGSQAGALVSKGENGLGTTFRIGAFTNQAGRTSRIQNGVTTYSENLMSFLCVMATEDNTTITFSDIDNNTEVENFSGTFPYDRVLNKGESYCIAMNSYSAVYPNNNKTGLIGSLITSNKPIVVNCGSANGSFDAGNGRDYGIDQIVDYSKVGTEYIFVKGNGTNAWENVLIVAHTNNTTININGDTTPIATINAGEFYVIEGDQYINNNMYVLTSEPVFAYQGIGGLNSDGQPSQANQGLFFVPPLNCEARGNLDNIADITSIGGLTYTGGINIVSKTGSTVSVNGTAISGGSPVTGKPDYVTYQLTGLSGNISVESTDELYVSYFNQNGVATSGSFYSGFPSAPEINFDVDFTPKGNCIGNDLKLSVANAQSFESFKWFFDDGSGFIEMSETSNEIIPTQPGIYKLIGIIPCTLRELESKEIPVSICPDDIDNDGIIDNLDIDNDNDGILNCTESRGDVTINLNDLNNPILEFQDTTTDATITSGTFTTTNSSGVANTFTGNDLGNFTSTVVAAASAEGNYAMTFTESVNVNLSEDISYIHTSVDGEFFIAKITPANKNITLLDPDDRLLVDSNFDGLFETGITQISGSEIHFKYNPSPLGATPFEFFANQVDGFGFIHRLSNLTDNSNFQAYISLNCFKNDNDNDGIKDELDLDSDNDGIPDFVENQGTLVALSGVDLDTNGLDDIYDINSLPIDTDSDGVVDFYDLDSDNDGIYDLIESGQLGILSDTDLDGIEDGPNYGVNGWADAAETLPDSNLIGYTPNDLDTDTIFSYLDLDSDGDGCSDVIEAGFSDGNADDLIGDNPVVTDPNNGVVINVSDGYSLPNSDYLDIAPITITTQPVNTTVCELSNGTISVVSPDAETYQWELSADGMNWNVLSDDMIYSGVTTENLTISNAQLSFDNYLFRVKLDRSGNSCGLYSDEVVLTVDTLPVANTAANMLLCDDDNNGTMPFDLESQNSSINTVSGMTITYHASQADADNRANPITSPFESGNTTIYARVENDANTTCYDVSSFDLEVYESPFPSLAVTPLQECDDTSVGTDTDGLKVFDLTQKETEILNGQSATDFSLTYFIDAAYSIPIVSPSSFVGSVPGGRTIYVRMTNNLYNTCIADTTFDVEVFSLPIVNNPNTYRQCDDASNDREAYFNLTLDWIKEEINPNYISEGLTFTYYNDQTQAETIGGIEIIDETNYFVDLSTNSSETVWIRATNPNGCYRVVPLSLEINPSSATLDNYNPDPLFQCDETGSTVRGNVASFNLTDIHNDILNIFVPLNVTIHFYESQVDAELETNEIPDISNHQNTSSPISQNIWVRVKSDLGNDCLGLREFTSLLNVETLPFAYPVTFSSQCDYDTNDTVLSYPFDTSNLEADILNGQDPMNVTITYFDNVGNPLLYADGTSVISPIQPTFLTENQTITVRVTNNSTNDPDGACYDETNVEFFIDEQPIIANQVSPQVFCDDGLDLTQENDGLHNFDLSAFESTIRGSQNNMEIYFTYIDENGSTVTNEATNFPNTLISSNQIIDVEVINPINTTCSAFTTIELSVNPLPEFILEEEILVCGNPFIPEDIIPVQINASETFTYEWRFEDGSIVGNTLVLPSSNIPLPGKYTLTLTNPTTLCSKTQTVDVKAADPPNITLDDIEIVDLSENNSVTIINPSSLGNSTYMFSLVSDDNQVYFPYQESPVFNNVRAGFYTLFAQDVETICDEVQLRISVIGHRKFFTPNGDGTNEHWQIQGLDMTHAGSVIRIFDRYGKLLKQLDPLSVGWDGTFNGVLMPTDDYWFSLTLPDGRSLLGHFTLKR
ncbi:T9SS type B sorting domain-containing protein [Seonamhaeicola aphaedonensis]|uniref:Gliding motility-associated-like protein n=1 Tax=Seonamhaeicola aphaedonensis TaxID=1461338 RepID=A0A3D9H719_9FLAO|nr:T9SS type B sorting domain-containing protein [Seonamhaeicola aphaedonensis]RED44951.1 gliding motility-associated-like protein [Seonamhaeicola aphaedonensis]